MEHCMWRLLQLWCNRFCWILLLSSSTFCLILLVTCDIFYLLLICNYILLHIAAIMQQFASWCCWHAVSFCFILLQIMQQFASCCYYNAITFFFSRYCYFAVHYTSYCNNLQPSRNTLNHSDSEWWPLEVLWPLLLLYFDPFEEIGVGCDPPREKISILGVT